MKRTALITTIILLAQWSMAQEIDSLQTEEPQVEPIIVEEQPLDSTSVVNENLQEITPEVMTPVDSSATPQEVVVYDTVFIEKPQESYYTHKRRNRNEIKTLSGRLGHSGGFGAVSFRSSKFRGETIVMAGLRGGWIINRSLAIGLEGHGLIPTAKYQGLSAFDAVLLGGYGGMFLEPIFFSNQVVHVTFPVSAGSGWIGYHEDFDEGRNGNSDLIDGDVFWYIEPGANVELNLARNFRLALGVSKRFTQDLDLVDTSGKAFNKINYYLTLKIGSF